MSHSHGSEAGAHSETERSEAIRAALKSNGGRHGEFITELAPVSWLTFVSSPKAFVVSIEGARLATPRTEGVPWSRGHRIVAETPSAQSAKRGVINVTYNSELVHQEPPCLCVSCVS